MRLPPGLRRSRSAPDRSASPRMMPATPRSRSRRIPSRSDTPPATRMSASVERTRRPRSSASGSAPPCARTKRWTPRATSSSTSASNDAGGEGRRQGNAASRSGRGSSPTASQSPATARQSARSGGSSTTSIARTTRVAPAAKASRICVGRSRGRRRAGSGPRRATRSRRRPRGSPGCRAARRRSRRGGSTRAPSSTNRSAIRSGRSVGAPTPADDAGPEDDPRAAALEVDRGDDLHAARVQAPRAARDAEPPELSTEAIVSRSSRRWKLIGSDPLRSSVSWNARSENAVAEARAARRPGAGAGGPCRAGTTAGRSACRCSGGPRPGRSRSSKLVVRRSGTRMASSTLDLAAVHPDVEDDPAGPPDRVGVHVQPEVRGVVEALLAHHLLGVHAPALDELRGVGQRAGSGSGGGSRRPAGGGGRDTPRGCSCC